MATTVIKTIKDKKYLYFSYYDNGKKCERYCGLASKPKSEKIALQFELEYVKEQKRNLTQEVFRIEKKLDNM